MAVFLQLLSVAIARAASLRRELTPRPPERDKLLIIRSTGDEPSGALAIFEFVSEITVRLFLAVQSWGARFEGLATKWASNKRKVLMVSLGAFVLQFPFLFCYAETSIHGSTASWLSKAALIGWGISILVSAGAIYLVLPFIGPEGVTTPLYLLRSALLWPVIVLLSLLLVFPFGWQVAVANILLDVTTETTPPGSWEINLIEPPTSEELGVPVLPLMHMAYENPQVLTKLGKWIEARGVNI